MRNRIMSDREALRRVIPKTDKDRRNLLKLLSYLVMIVCVVVGLLYLKRAAQENREQNWSSAAATIKDARPKLVGQQSRGMLYQVEILAQYPINGVIQERWIVVVKVPMSLENVEFDAARWRGNKCVVRWEPSDPDKVIAEAS